MTALLALLVNGFRESRRNRVTVVVFLFAFVMVFSATFALELTVVTFARVLTDLGLGVMGLIAVFLSVFLSTGLLPREIERRTIYMIVSKPVSRSAFLVGRLLANLATVGFVTAMMVALFLLQMVWEGAPMGAPHAAAIIGLFLEIVVVSSVGFFFASFSSQFVSAVSTVGLYFVGHLAGDLYRMVHRSKSELVRYGGEALYYLLPNLDRLDFKARATYMDPTPWSEVAASGAYALGYSVVLIAVACFFFERRDFK